MVSLELINIQEQIDSNVSHVGETQINQLGDAIAHDNDGSSAEGKKAPMVDRVVELPILKERTPMECLPLNHDTFAKRITYFEQWLGEQPEDVIAIVGHSQYFKSMLGLHTKIKNCDVWSLQFDNSI